VQRDLLLNVSPEKRSRAQCGDRLCSRIQCECPASRM